MNAIIVQMISLLANMILKQGYFERVIGVVKRWQEKELSGAQKREGVLKEFEIIGLELTGFLANIATELAVGYIKYSAGQGDKPNVVDTVKKDLGA